MLIRCVWTVCMIALLGRQVYAHDELRIGWIGALSGDAAAIGRESLAAVELAVDELNLSGGVHGKRVTLIAEDDGYDVARALGAYRSIVPRINSRIVFMSTYGALFALGEAPVRDGVLVLDGLDCNDALARISKNHFCLATRTESIAETFAQLIARDDTSGKVAVLHEVEAWFEYIITKLEQLLPGRVLRFPADTRAGDYRAQLLAIAASGARHLIFLGNDSMGRAVSQASEIGLQLAQYSIGSAASPGFRSLAGRGIEGLKVSHWEVSGSDLKEHFRQAYARLHGRAPGLEFVAVPTYDLARLVGEQLRRVQPRYDAQELRAALLSRRNFPGVAGLITFDPDGAVRSLNERAFTVAGEKLMPME